MTNNTIQHLFQGQMDYVFFFQGLAFLLVVLVCFLLRSDSQQRLPWHWFGLFALTQGIAAWLSLVTLNFSGLAFLPTLIGIIQIFSLLFLTEFGRSGMGRLKDSDSGLWLISLLLMLTALGGLKGWPGIKLTSLYTFGLIGGLWAAAALFFAGRGLPPRDRGGSITASICLGLFALSTALFPPPSSLFPASKLNQDILLSFLSVPSEFCQGLLAFGMAAGIYGFLPGRERIEDRQARYRSRYMFALLAILSLILGLGSILTLYLGDWANKKHTQIRTEAQEYASILVNRLNVEFKRYEDGVKGLAETSWLAFSLRFARDGEILDRVNTLLDRYKDSLDASVCYVMDRSGKTIASSNRQEPDSFIGHSYAFRPYFKQAIDGGTGRYFAVGVTSKVPGYYVSHPVQVRGQLARGVAVVKVALDKITNEMQAAVKTGDSLMCLADPRGVVFLSSQPDMIFKSLWPVNEQDKADLKQQYGKDSFPAIFPEKITNGSRVELNGQTYMVSDAGTIHTGWSVFFFRPIEHAGMYRLFGIALACMLAVLALAILGSNFYIKEHALSSDERHRIIFNQAPEAIVVIDPDTLKIIEANSRLADSLGYTPKELLNLKLVDILNQKPEESRHQLFQILQQDGVVLQNWSFLKKDGSPLTLEIVGSRFRYGGKGQLLAFGREVVAVPRLQITELLEEDRGKKDYQPVPPDLQVGSKMNQFKNILSTLILQTEDTLQELPPGAETRQNLEEILRSSMKAKDLIRDLVIPIPATLSEATSVNAKREHILLVDDETQLCHLEEKLLKRMGYRVSAFTDSLEALKAFQRKPDAFDLVITDSSMSQLPGLDLAKVVLKLRPTIPVILATGFGDKDKISLAKQLGIRECIEKPILSSDLDKTIRRVLQGS
jgi:PAS domain S-box-containing protein